MEILIGAYSNKHARARSARATFPWGVSLRNNHVMRMGLFGLCIGVALAVPGWAQGGAGTNGAAMVSAIPPGKILIFSPRTRDMKEFEILARAAKEAGFTHVRISELSGRTDLQGLDKDSPWCDWSTILPTIFKHSTPPGIEDAYPADFVKRERALMKAKYDIAEKLGLRAAYYGLEPNWLNDAVYRKHPQWRGSRADNALRSTGMYFAPNTDHPEVRELYRWALKDICTLCPNLDVFQFVTNDSGAFYPWAQRLFVNQHGPTGYENRDMGERVVGFLQALRQGALDAGVDAHFYTAQGFTTEERLLLQKSLQPGIGVEGMAPEPYTEEGSLSGCGSWGGTGWMPALPVNKQPTPMEVVGGVANLKTSKVRRFGSGGNSLDYFVAFKAALACPPATSVRSRLDVLEKVAAAVYAPDVVDAVIQAWDSLELAYTMMDGSSGFGVDVWTGPVMGRWINRPLVAHQELLTEDERAYWEPYLYQSKVAQPDTYLDYLTILPYPEATTWEEASKTCMYIDRVSDILASAANGLSAAAGKTENAQARAKLKLDADRVRVLRCLTLTVRQYLQVGTLIRQRDLENAQAPKLTTIEPISPNLPKGNLGSSGLFFMHRAMRWELDNTYELISLLEQSPEPLIFTEQDQANEGSLLLGPHLLEQLHRKVEIMLKYWRTAEDGYYQPTKGG